LGRRGDCLPHQIQKPGGELHYLPITPAISAILSRERGRHPHQVFT
jgi:hypothetical protein